MNRFVFKSYDFDKATSTATFSYAYQGGRAFEESVTFEPGDGYNDKLLDRALFLAFVLVGTSYYKTFPSSMVGLDMPIDEWQASFFNTVYQEGLGQFAFENNLQRDNLAYFTANSQLPNRAYGYDGSGILALQSGGKDSLLTASLLDKNHKEFTSYYISSGTHYPDLLEAIGVRLVRSIRTIDTVGLMGAMDDGAKNGHVPVTYILQSLAIIQAILMNKSDVITSIAHEGEEPHHHIGNLAVTHQWSKTWAAETAFAEYVSRYISPNLQIGSPLRKYSELRVAELFVNYSWNKYGHEFSSCNQANYRQGSDNSVLLWCGNCPKCANSYLLFAAFLPSIELKSLFATQDLFLKPSLVTTFKGLLGVEGIPKPFECIGEIEELRLAYQASQTKSDYGSLPFDVPHSSFDYLKTYPIQDWAERMLK